MPGPGNEIEIVLDGDDRLSRGEKLREKTEQPVDIGRVEPGRRFVEEIKGAAPGRVHQLRGELEALPFPAGERVEGLAEPQIIQTDLGQERQA